MSGAGANEEKRLEEEYARILGELHSEPRTGMDPGAGVAARGIRWVNETNEGRIAGLMSPVTQTRYTPNGTKANLYKEKYNPKYTNAAAIYKSIMTIKLPTLHTQMGILQDTIASQHAAIAEEAPQIPPGEVESRRARLIVIRNEMIKLSSHILSICSQIKAIYERRAYLYTKFASQIEPDDVMGAGGAGAPGEYIPEEAIITELEALEKEEARSEAEFDKLKELYAILKQIIDLRKQKGGYKKRATRRVKKTRRSKSRR